VTWALVAVVAWGAFSFGAVYPWAYWPLAFGALACGLMALLPRGRDIAHPAIVGVLGLIALVLLVQAVPLPEQWHRWLSPALHPALMALDPVYALAGGGSHPLSLVPRQTLMTLALFTAFSIMLLGASSLFTREGPERTIELLVGLGAALAIIGIIHEPLYHGRIYGFWELPDGRDPFGPFINKNHFAGWMVMCLPLAIGMFFRRLSRTTRAVKPGVRARLLWLSSPEANQLVLVGFAAIVMAVSLVLTFSRSGIVAMALAVLLTGWLFGKSKEPLAKKLVAVAYLVALVLMVGMFVAPERVAQRFEQADWESLNQRVGPWTDAVRVFRLYPVAGSGLGTYGTAMLLYQQHDTERHYREAHNDYLQLLAEGGILVTVLVLLGLGTVVWLTKRRLKEDRNSSRYWLRAGASMALIAIALQETVEFSLQMPGNAAMFTILCAVAIHKAPTRKTSVRAVAPTPASSLLTPDGSWQK